MNSGGLADHSLTAAQISQWRPLIIAAAVVSGLVVPAVWLWMARASSRGRDWARILSTVLFGLATLQLPGALGAPTPVMSGVWVFGSALTALTWLAGLAAVWLPVQLRVRVTLGTTYAEHPW